MFDEGDRQLVPRPQTFARVVRLLIERVGPAVVFLGSDPGSFAALGGKRVAELPGQAVVAHQVRGTEPVERLWVVGGVDGSRWRSMTYTVGPHKSTEIGSLCIEEPPSRRAGRREESEDERGRGADYEPLTATARHVSVIHLHIAAAGALASTAATGMRMITIVISPCRDDRVVAEGIRRRTCGMRSSLGGSR